MPLHIISLRSFLILSLHLCLISQLVFSLYFLIEMLYAFLVSITLATFSMIVCESENCGTSLYKFTPASHYYFLGPKILPNISVTRTLIILAPWLTITGSRLDDWIY
jgi:hypothetical protein